jgi:hypothetical protein
MMAKNLVVCFNNTDDTIDFVNLEDSANNCTLKSGTMFRTATHFKIPDNSNSKDYFNQHHMEIWAKQVDPNDPLFSFWDNDDKGFVINVCDKKNWETTTKNMDGYFNGEEGDPVGIVVYRDSGGYRIEAIKVNNR